MFAATLVGLRSDIGIPSQAELARRIEVSEATVQRWEALDKPNLPDAWELRRLCEVLEVEPDELVSPQPMSERERQLARRAVRATRRGIDRGREAS